jgi:predicted transcriptional regulator
MIDIQIKNKVTQLRQEGYSIKEIAKEVNIAQSTVSLFVRKTKLNHKAKNILLRKRQAGREKAVRTIIRNREEREKRSIIVAENFLEGVNITKAISFLVAAVSYECEGGKSNFGVLEFTNSDPVLIRLFLLSLRKSFLLDENKFRVVMHLHSYHNEKDEQIFWSDVTSIPKQLFTKTFQKKESGITRKEGYHGCVQIKYFDVNIKRTLLAAKFILAKKMGL